MPDVKSLQSELALITHRANQRLREIEKNFPDAKGLSYAYQEALSFIHGSRGASLNRFRENFKSITDIKELEKQKRNVELFLSRPSSKIKPLRQIQKNRKEQIKKIVGEKFFDDEDAIQTERDINQIYKILRENNIFSLYGSDDAVTFSKVAIDNDLRLTQIKDWARKTRARATGTSKAWTDRDFGYDDAMELLGHYLP